MTQWTPIMGLKEYGRVVGRKMLYIALAWIVVYWISQPFRTTPSDAAINALMLFSPLIGALGGLVAGWYMATDAVEDSGLTGLGLWVILVAAACIPMWAVEGLMHLVFWWRPFGFGGWMLMSAAMLMALASAVWHASSQE
jgi:hypothetical protein